MNLDFLLPLEEPFFEMISDYSETSLSYFTAIHSKEKGLPDLENVSIAILGVQDGRGAVGNDTTGYGVDAIRSYFYKLYPGNWSVNIADLGNIPQGNTVSDTYFALREVIASLVKKNIVPIILGGGQDLTYANYRAYDQLEQLVNIVTVDSKFDLGAIDSPLDSSSFLSKIVMEEPANMFNYSNIGYQTFFNAQEEIDLLQSLSFDTYRLGEAKDLKIVEPIMRDADIVSIDIGAVRMSDAPANGNATPNGFYGDDICAISRYAGISDKVTSFGIYEFNNRLDNNGQTAHLIAQMIWYFVEGFSFRAKDYPYCTKESYLKFIVPHEEEDMIFYKSHKSGRWWLEIHSRDDNKYKRHALIPCTHQDYLDATDQKVPERWYKALKKIN
ncbi:formimidoylglutamase [Flavicella marina]|uniref:formimidoylglutamase n=1 Tax=Flavicella marina TaxID=1475951 RepID=UPI001264BC38|nr:formimidoylglutamase [Flavicella marina]